MNSSLTTYERRQRIVDLLRQQAGIKATELAKLLEVSEGTIRNDLRTLQKKGQLRRVRGGAVLKDDYQICNPEFAVRARVNAVAKQRIARWAADLVEDGDAILLDASTTVFHMAPWLQQRRNLTIVTNCIETGLALSQNSDHTVILIGGILRADGLSVVGHLGERTLDELNIKTAFVSCSGFSVEAGLTEVDIQDTPVKRKMLQSANQVVALIDSSKFGRVDLTPFAGVDQISHIFTDTEVAPEFVEQLRSTSIPLSICSENTMSPVTAPRDVADHYRIGFANLCDQMPFAIDVRRGLEQVARQANNVELIVSDNQLNGEVALKVANRLLTKELDLIIEFQVDHDMGTIIMDRFRQANIPVIAVDIPMVGATFFGADNYRAGYLAGRALGEWIKDQWQGQFDRLIMLKESRAGTLTHARMHGQLMGVQEIVGQIPESKIIRFDGGVTTENSEEQMLELLESLPDEHRLAVISLNDDVALGALAAARSLGREEDLAVVGQGADRKGRQEIRRPGSRMVGSTAYWPEKYGEMLLELAYKILGREVVPPAVHVDHIFINAQNIDDFYPDDQPD
jgi:ribose transport system substrate-binding protein